MEGKITIREYQAGDPSRVTYYYYMLFKNRFNFNPIVERYFMEGMLELFDTGESSQMWLLERKNEVVGSIAIVKQGEYDAQLRWFGVDESLQGLGMGSKLMTLAMDFCREKGYSHVVLWTIDILEPARHLYTKFGFELTETKPNYEWANIPLVEEKWEYFGC